MSQQSFLCKSEMQQQKPLKSENVLDIKNFTMKKYEDHLEKIIHSKGKHSHII